MTAASVRRVTIGVCAAGIAGMIVTSILNHNGAAVTFGLVTAVSVLCSMVATSVERERPGGVGGRGDGKAGGEGDGHAGGPAADPDALAPLVEARIQELVAAGVDEVSVRTLVGEAVRLGRSLRT